MDEPLQPGDAQPLDQAGPSLWLLLYGGLWLNLALLAVLLSWGRPGAAGWPAMLAWSLALAALAAFACNLRLLIHDTLTALTLRDRACLALLVAALPSGAIFLPHATVLGDGLLWVGAVLLTMAIRPELARLALLAALLGTFHAAATLPAEPLPLGLLALWFSSWLAALGAMHFTFTGEPHGLRGWWPLRSVLSQALLATVPALLAAGLAFMFWPADAGRGPHVAPRPGVDPADVRRSLAQRMGQLDLATLLLHGLTLVLTTALLLVLLHYARKLWLRRRARVRLDVLPGQVGELERLVRGAAEPARQLSGRRGQIAALWGRWALARGAENPRQPGETAREFAGRVGQAEAPPIPPAEITALLEAAHYGPAEPTEDDVELLRAAVEADLARRP